jgi:hypothetical protein
MNFDSWYTIGDYRAKVRLNVIIKMIRLPNAMQINRRCA